MILPPLLSLKWLPERGSKGLWYLLTTYDFLSQLIWIVTASIIYSLYADVTDDVVLRLASVWRGRYSRARHLSRESRWALAHCLPACCLP